MEFFLILALVVAAISSLMAIGCAIAAIESYDSASLIGISITSSIIATALCGTIYYGYSLEQQIAYYKTIVPKESQYEYIELQKQAQDFLTDDKDKSK